MPTSYKRDISELETNAVLWWPKFLSSLEENASIIPRLIETQDDFLSMLNLCSGGPFQIFDVMRASKFPANLFLKHLMVLSDFGGEQIQRINREFRSIFKGRSFDFSWREKSYSYTFKRLPVRGTLNNPKIGIDGRGLQNKMQLDELKEDLIAMLLFASTSIDEGIADRLSQCEVGSMMGHKAALEGYTKQKYIWVSRITGGAKANSLGQIAQTYAVDYIRKELGGGYDVVRNGTIRSRSAERGMPFDIVVVRGGKKVGIEVTFQVTTNSTIERKAGQAVARRSIMKESGNYIAYIVDGAGNFQRRSAISRICENSDCTVAYSDSEFDVLIEFIKRVLG